MQAWEKNYSPKEISYLASYIKTMRGTNPPNPKPAQGEFYVDEVVAADSAKVIKPDSAVLVAKPDTAGLM